MTIQPCSFPNGEEYRAGREQQGFRIIALDRFRRPTNLPISISCPQSFFRLRGWGLRQPVHLCVTAPSA